MIVTGESKMKTSQSGLEFIAKWEGIILKPYNDVAGLRTIGVGHLIRSDEDFQDGVAITTERAYEILAVDVAKCESAIQKTISVDLTQNQFDALVSFGFNCGVGVYSTSTACKMLNAGNYNSFPANLMAWSKARINGVVTTVPGLAARRTAEGQLFTKPIFEEGFVQWTHSSLQEAQTMLNKLGLYNRGIDGVWGPGTAGAVKVFADQMNISLSQDTSYGVPKDLIDALRTKTS
jgi:lysozyme